MDKTLIRTSDIILINPILTSFSLFSLTVSPKGAGENATLSRKLKLDEFNCLLIGLIIYKNL